MDKVTLIHFGPMEFPIEFDTGEAPRGVVDKRYAL